MIGRPALQFGRCYYLKRSLVSYLALVRWPFHTYSGLPPNPGMNLDVTQSVYDISQVHTASLNPMPCGVLEIKLGSLMVIT
jgi:hypothetical protein